MDEKDKDEILTAINRIVNRIGPLLLTLDRLENTVQALACVVGAMCVIILMRFILP